MNRPRKERLHRPRVPAYLESLPAVTLWKLRPFRDISPSDLGGPSVRSVRCWGPVCRGGFGVGPCGPAGLGPVEIPCPYTQTEPFVYNESMTTTKKNSPKVYGYARVSTAEQHDAGAGLPAQVHALEQTAAARGWALEVVTEQTGVSAGSMAKRPALVAVLADLDRNGGTLVVTKLDRLSRSVADFAALLDRSRRKGWTLVCLDLGIDTTTAAGEMVANLMAAVAQWERRTIGERTRAGMAERKRQGVHCGRRRELPAAVVERIVAERQQGRTLAAIAGALNAENVPTAHRNDRKDGKPTTWHPSTVRAVLSSSSAAAMLAA